MVFPSRFPRPFWLFTLVACAWVVDRCWFPWVACARVVGRCFLSNFPGCGVFLFRCLCGLGPVGGLLVLFGYSGAFCFELLPLFFCFFFFG